MEIKGRLQKFLPLVEGTSARGPWKKQEFLLETLDNYPKQVCISTWGDKADEIKKYNEGDIITCSLEISSREYNGKWYTEVRAWKVMAANDGGMSMNTNSVNSSPFDNVPFPTEPTVTIDKSIPSSNDWEGDLPF